MPQFCILFYANYTLLTTQREWPWHHVSPKYAPGPHIQTNNIVCDKAVRQLQQIRNNKKFANDISEFRYLIYDHKKIRINSFTKRSAIRIVTRKVC